MIDQVSTRLPAFNIDPPVYNEPALNWTPVSPPALPPESTYRSRSAAEILAEASMDAHGRTSDRWVGPAAWTIGTISCAIGGPLALEGVLSHTPAYVAIGTSVVIVGLGFDLALTIFGRRIFGSRHFL